MYDKHDKTFKKLKGLPFFRDTAYATELQVFLYRQKTAVTLTGKGYQQVMLIVFESVCDIIRIKTSTEIKFRIMRTKFSNIR